MADSPSLLGKADSTLVQASLSQARANVPSDLSEIYKLEADTVDMFTQGVTTYFDVLHQDHNKLKDELIDSVKTVTANLSAGTMPDDEGINLYTEHLTGLKERLKGIPKGKQGDVERAKIRAELNRLQNSTKAMEDVQEDVMTRIESSDFIPGAVPKEDLQILKAISNGNAKREIVNGSLVYSIPGTDTKITHNDLNELLVSNNPELNSKVNEVTVSASQLDPSANFQDKRQGFINAYEKTINSKSDYASLVWQKQGDMEFSFAEILAGKGDKSTNMAIYKALKDLGVENIPEDTDGDGKITEADFATPENGIAFIESLTNTKAQGFDLNRNRKILAEFFTDNLAAGEFVDAGGDITRGTTGTGTGTETGTETGGTKTSIKISAPSSLKMGDRGESVPKSEIKPLHDGFKLAAEGKEASITAPNLKGIEERLRGKEIKFNTKSGTWFIEESEDNIIQLGNSAKLMRDLSLTDKSFTGLNKADKDIYIKKSEEQQYERDLDTRQNRLVGYSGNESSVYGGIRGGTGYYSVSGDTGKMYTDETGEPNPYKLVDEIWTKSTGLLPGEAKLYQNPNVASGSRGKKASPKDVAGRFAKRFGFFDFNIDGNGRMKIQYDLDNFDFMKKRGVDPNFIEFLKKQKSKGVFKQDAKIGKKGTYDVAEDMNKQALKYGSKTVDPTDYEGMKDALEYMNRVVGFYAELETRWANQVKTF